MSVCEGVSNAVCANPVDARAALWLERCDREDWNGFDQAELDAWLAESPAHMVAWLRLYDAWNRADRLAALRSPIADSSQRGGNLLQLLIRIAAVVALVVAVGALATNYLLQPRDQQFATPIGGRETIKLSDGSSIELNTDTILHVRGGVNERTVTLDKGEAYFQVKHDASRPFVVVAANGRVIDVGTKFVVRNSPGHLEVALVEGRARFETIGAKAQAADLTPGDVVVSTADATAVTRKSAQALANELGWRRGVLVFDHTALADAAAELNRYNREKVVIADPETGKRIIGATLPTNDIEAFTRVAREIFGLHIEKKGNEIVVSR